MITKRANSVKNNLRATNDVINEIPRDFDKKHQFPLIKVSGHQIWTVRLIGDTN